MHNTVTLTPNRRLATFLQQQYNLQQQALGRVVWEEPQIYPINVWLDQLWSKVTWGALTCIYKILTPMEQQLIWEAIISGSDIGQQLLNVKMTAEQAVKSWEFLQQWQIPLAEMLGYVEIGSDSAAFLTWADSYQQQCAINKWLDFYSMVGLLIPQIKNIAELPAACTFYAFQELSPQQQSLIVALRQAGVKVNELQPAVGLTDDVVAISAENAEHEYQLAAHWAMQQSPSATIGIVIPELDKCRKDVERIFAEVFTHPNYNISAPKPMAAYAMIDTALLIMQLALNQNADVELFSRLLRSEFISNIDEICARSALDVALRDLQESKFSWQFLDIKLANIFASVETANSCQQFSSHYQHWRGLMPSLHGKRQSTREWLDVVVKLLQSLHWPGDRIKTVADQHLFGCWRALLGEYLQLDAILGEHDFFKALQIISKLAATTPFLPETKQKPIQVLGILEAAGMQFDKLWLVGMQRDVWPPEPKPNPFIPFAIQRKYDLPRSSPQRELQVAKNLSAVLLAGGTQQVVVSFPQMVENATTDISPLFRKLPRVSAKVLVAQTGDVFEKNKFRISNCEYIVDDLAPSYLPATVGAVPGGSRVLKRQSNCPFWAFAEIRLGANPIKQKTIGLTAAERGTLLHEVMAEFWQQVGSQEQLHALSLGAQQTMLTDAIAKCLTKFKHKRPYILTADYILLESARLQQLLSTWLDLEAKREPFTVYKIEAASLVRLGTLDFKVRLDRIDRLATGDVVIIDYKTSRPHASDWFGARPADPQLPLYCIATELLANEIAFAVVRPETIVLQEYSRITNYQKADSWAEQLQVWQKNLTRLATEFAAGHAEADPLKGSTTCQYCSLETLCRI